MLAVDDEEVVRAVVRRALRDVQEVRRDPSSRVRVRVRRMHRGLRAHERSVRWHRPRRRPRLERGRVVLVVRDEDVRDGAVASRDGVQPVLDDERVVHGEQRLLGELPTVRAPQLRRERGAVGGREDQRGRLRGVVRRRLERDGAAARGRGSGVGGGWGVIRPASSQRDPN